MKSFELPEDVWGVVMSFFHSSYKKPSHYIAITTTNDFYRKMRYIKYSSNSKTPFDSYYAHIISSNWSYWMLSDLHDRLIRPEVTLTRGVAKGKIRSEFIEIWKTYQNNDNYNGQVTFAYV